jgi:magnesium-transporting ATPase (P-type)
MNCLLAIVDPCRESAAEAIRICHAAGINVKMITGDHPDTACYIAKQLGIINDATFKRYIAIKDDPTLAEERKRIVMKTDDVSCFRWAASVHRDLSAYEYLCAD